MGVLIAATGLWLWRSPTPGHFWTEREPPSSALRGGRALPVLPGVLTVTTGSPGPDNAAAAAEPPLSIADRVPLLMQDWRNAILNRDADTVLLLDRSFAAYPREFIPALMASAKSDPAERVRSFSTRVLGKLRPQETSELMRSLLGDPSEYVRSNAAWALGELGDHDATLRLRQLEKRDPSATVRRSAGESLRKMNGG